MKEHCGHHHDKEKLYRRILIGVIALIVIVGLTIFIVWAILQPKKPKFILQEAMVFEFNITGPYFLNSRLQVTITTKNPNDKIGIYYEKLDVYGSYRGQQVTLVTELPRTYMGHNDISVWSPFLYGNSVPVSPYLATALCEDANAGLVLLNIKIDGRLRWKVGSWHSGRYHLHVNCPAYLGFGSHNNGIVVDAGVKYQFAQSCTVDV